MRERVARRGVELPPAGRFAADVARDLQRAPKQLQAQYLYDDLGSSLFEAICRLPWYGVTRGEARLLEAHAGDVAARAVAPAARLAIAELGVGSGEKLLTLLDALPAAGLETVHLIDISAAALDAAEARIVRTSPVPVIRHESTYHEGLDRVAASGRLADRHLVLFLGSNIGNFDPQAAADLLGSLRRALLPGDLLLLGADLVKPAADLVRAYDDPLGVTAAFNRNLLVRMNRELDADFDLSAFTHRAVWKPAARRIEMHLVSRREQQVEIPAAHLRVTFRRGESIWTESSYKYDEPEIAALGRSCGFSPVDQWVEADTRFALTLFTAV